MLDPPASDWVEEARPPASFAHPAPTLNYLKLLVPPGSRRYDLAVTNEQRYEVNRPEVVDESVDGEVLIVHLGTGNYYSARGSGEAIWQLFAAGSTLSEVLAAINGSAPAADASTAVERFLGTLREEELLRPRSAEAPPVGSAEPLSAFSEPLLEKYTDMQELLLLDPIHDVEETGWPNVKPGALET